MADLICYMDESGDDGLNTKSSPYFILSSVYMSTIDWKANFQSHQHFRLHLRERYGFPIKTEFHSRQFLQDKNPYHGLYTPETRREIFFAYAQHISTLNIKIINVIIDKRNINPNRTKYDVLNEALTYSIQRLENSIIRSQNTETPRYLIFVDEGRIQKMRRTSRKIQSFNPIPSAVHPNSFQNKPIKLLIEDPIAKPSSESYFIQIADFIATSVSLYYAAFCPFPTIEWSNRIRLVLNHPADSLEIIKLLQPVLNLKASKSNQYGLVIYPKK